MATSSAPSFTTHASLSKFANIPQNDLLRTLQARTSKHLDGLATGGVVFQDYPPMPTSTSSPTSSPSPRILLVQRAPTDSMPLRWETPGGAVDDTDADILVGACREVVEEVGLVAASVDALVAYRGRKGQGIGDAEEDDVLEGGYMFHTRSGKTIVKFTFVIRAQKKEEEEGEDVKVRLDPDEHVDYLWATEEECRSRKVARKSGREGDTVDIEFTTEAQEALLMSAFAWFKENVAPS
ncbi:hypothetical protein BD289DRAFT_446594 [Coniella lustricola]|uniref:Nudix hydrolase domain-containing protein n=1 Tax=Coniella lustricola TaxID=2025994 RepID=A0A2T2ZTS0_9PEZI|nr:hypothetical protein BD289DRAFT_446594 [Coniella lustricola]